MGNEQGYVQAGKEQLHYLRIGSGRRLLLAFHGYGNEAGLFIPFHKYLGDEFAIISVDLPYHGKSKWKEGGRLKKKDLVVVVQRLMQLANVDKVSLLGYSIGGRLCLSIVEQMPQSIDKVLLIAPDGLAFNPLYFFVTKTFIGKRLFKSVLTQPARFLRIVSWLKEKNYIDNSRYKFAMQYLQSEESRKFLLHVWPGLSDIIPDRKRLKAAIKKYQLPVYIFMGAYDRIIPPSLAEEFKKDMSTVHLYVLDKGHRVFDYDNMPQMAQCLL